MYCHHCGRKLEDQALFCSECGTARSGVASRPREAYERPSLSRVRDGKIAGVCGGVARYLDADPTLVRILWILAALFPPLPGIVAYIVCWAVMPIDPPPVVSPVSQHP
jgi:phage shock protein C